MGYKDKQKHREYQKEWARRKRAGLPTKIVNKVKKSKEEIQKIKRLWFKKDRQKIYNERIKVWGNRCYLCSRETIHLILHNKNGEKHDTNYSYIKKALKNPERWVRLCKSCHTGVHFCMNFFNMKWEDIENIVLKNKKGLSLNFLL